MAEDLKNEKIESTVEKASTKLTDIEGISGTINFLKKYQLYFLIPIAAILLFVLYNQFFSKKTDVAKELKADNAINMNSQYISQDSFDIALNGGANGEGLLSIIKKNKGNITGKTASMEAAIAYLKSNRPKEALKLLEDATGFGKQINARRLSLIGDAKSSIGTENGKVDNKVCEDACGYYEKAANEFPEDEMSALYLQRAGELYEKIGKREEAKKAFVKIKEKFPTYPQIADVEKSLGKLGVEN
jgi:tetratricopeptide (TPR) repeat protein